MGKSTPSPVAGPGPAVLSCAASGTQPRLSDPLRGPCGLWVKGKRRGSRARLPTDLSPVPRGVGPGALGTCG